MKGKKIVAKVLAITMLLSSGSAFWGEENSPFTLKVSAENEKPTSGKCGDNVTWKIDSNGTLTISGKGELTNAPWQDNFEDDIKYLVIKSGVSDIMWDAFSGCQNLKSITISESITSLWWLTWTSEESLTDYYIDPQNKYFTSIDGVIYNKDITEIEECPNCKTKVLLPETLTSIGNNAFMNCSELKDLVIPENVTNIGEYAFQNCTGLTSISIPNGVTEIRDYTFYGCENLASISIPKSVSSISGTAFLECRNLNSFIVDENNSSYSSYDGLLYSKDMTKLISCPKNKNEVKLSNKVKILNDNAFNGCDRLENIIIPNSVTEIGEGTFENCTSLKKIIIPNKVSAIKNGTFNFCYSLEDIIISESVNSIDDQCFFSCYNLRNIVVDEKNNSYSSIDGVLYNKENTEIIMCPVNKSEVVLPNSLKTIKSAAFNECEKLKSISIPSGVETIEDQAFYNCTNLKNINIPDSVTNIGRDAFHETSWLESKQSENPLVIINGILIDAEKCSETVIIPKSVLHIGDGAFANNQKTTHVDIPNSVISVGVRAFSECENLTNVNLYEGISTIGTEAFYGCRNLKSITIPESVTTIGDYALGYYMDFYEWDAVDFKVEDFTVYGFKQSAAEKYAAENDYNFIEIKELKNPPNEMISPKSGIKIVANNSAAAQGDEIKFDIYITGDAPIQGMQFTIEAEGGEIVEDVSYDEQEKGWLDNGFEWDHDGIDKLHWDRVPCHYYTGGILSQSGINTVDGKDAKGTRADVNLDGKIDVADIVIICNHIRGKKPLWDYNDNYNDTEPYEIGDVDLDGKISILDCGQITSHINGIKNLDGIKSAAKPFQIMGFNQEAKGIVPGDEGIKIGTISVIKTQESPLKLTVNDGIAIYCNEDFQVCYAEFIVDNSWAVVYTPGYVDHTSNDMDNETTDSETTDDETTSDEDKTSNKGDANGDGEINVTDIAVTAAHIKGIKALDENAVKAADVNSDNQVNVTDIAMIAAHIKGIKAIG